MQAPGFTTPKPCSESGAGAQKLTFCFEPGSLRTMVLKIAVHNLQVNCFGSN